MTLLWTIGVIKTNNSQKNDCYMRMNDFQYFNK